MATQRPFFHVPGITEEQARFFTKNAVLSIVYGWKMLDNERAEDWFNLMVNDNTEGLTIDGRRPFYGEMLVVGLRVARIPDCVEFVRVPSGNRGLLQIRTSVSDQIKAIDRWDQENEADIAEFQRLKEKLGL